ncbi:MAG: hypothetical protein ACYTGF_14325 [Planctomycetota bacterium]|jgi:hypothetical protein
MRQKPDQSPRDRGPEHVYEGPAELREVDDLLGRYARREPVPDGLIERVFDASVGMLPARRRRQHPLRLQPVITTSLWGRLAMAASIALAFFVAGRILPMREPSSLLSPDVELVLLEYAGAGDLDVSRRFREIEEARYGAMERLLVTRDMTFRDLAGDLANLAADLEM